MDENIKAEFNKQWHEELGGTWHTMRWLGVKALKTPTDFWIYQELIVKIKPTWIIETGTCFGGSALFLATVCASLGKGQVISIDINKPKRPVKHARIEFYRGNSIAPETIAAIKKRLSRRPGPVMVILDSNHKKKHVAQELDLYGPLVTKGSYMIVEDTDINKSVRFDHGPGPGDAVDEWLPKQDRFVVDKSCEKYHLTFCPGGYLKCVR